MRVIDMHLNPQVASDLKGLTSVTLDDLATACEFYEDRFASGSEGLGVMVVLNPGVLAQPGANDAFARILGRGKIAFSITPDFRDPQAEAQVDAARALGVKFVKFHPYMHRIEPADFDRCADIARRAESLGLLIMVCCSYGTRDLDRFSGLKLVAHLSRVVSCPIVMSHAGGAQILDAMLVAEDAPNVYLDTSFSLPYYIGSSVEGDIAFVMRKVGTHRWVYGSDAPYFGLEDALRMTISFFERHGFTDNEVDDVLYGTAAGLLGCAK